MLVSSIYSEPYEIQGHVKVLNFLKVYFMSDVAMLLGLLDRQGVEDVRIVYSMDTIRVSWNLESWEFDREGMLNVGHDRESTQNNHAATVPEWFA